MICACSSYCALSRWNFSSCTVIAVASIRILPPGWRSAAGLMAGSVPTMASAGYVLRSVRMAALVAVLHATTSAFAP